MKTLSVFDCILLAWGSACMTIILGIVLATAIWPVNHEFAAVPHSREHIGPAADDGVRFVRSVHLDATQVIDLR